MFSGQHMSRALVMLTLVLSCALACKLTALKIHHKPVLTVAMTLKEHLAQLCACLLGNTTV